MSLPPPINHSTLTKMLYDLEQASSVPLHHRLGMIVRASSGGVVEEGGILVVAERRETVEVKSGFKFGQSSEKELVGVDSRLVRVTRRALEICEQDFLVFDGLRTQAEQQMLVKRGMSKTLNSKHLVGLAVDLVPYIDGKPTWDWLGCAKIAFAVDRAAMEQGVDHLITWGGAWDRQLNDFGGSLEKYMAEVELYKKRHAGKDFIDGPHFQIEKK